MRFHRWLLAGAIGTIAARALPAQRDDGATSAVVRDTAGPQYAAGALRRMLLGSTWREEWITPVDVPILELGSHGGGLTPVREGGNQSRTLHFNGADGRRYVFRTADKRLAPRFNADLLGTPVGGIIEDLLSSLHPASVLMAHVIEDAAGVLHPEPRLVQLPDDSRLGAFRESFAFRLGYIAERPDDVPPGVASFAGAHRFLGADRLLEQLDASPRFQLDARAWLTARLVDGLLGDFDRGADQWEFGCFEEGTGYRCLPIARDRDWAFMRANGLVMRLVRASSPKLGRFDDTRVSLRSMTAMTVEFDRSHLVGLSWATWDSVTRALQSHLPDAILEEAVRAQPIRYQRESSRHILMKSLRGRRDRLPQLAREFYALVNGQADVFGTDTSDVVDVERVPDGSVRVVVGHRGTSIVFDRTFLPGETREIRIYLQDGDDQVIVRGRSGRSIPIRVTGGAGSDVLVDSSEVTAGGTWTTFYDASGDNRITAGRVTRTDLRPYVTAQPVRLDASPGDSVVPRAVAEERRGRFEDQRPGAAVGPVGLAEAGTPSDRSWGHRTILQPAFDYKDGAGVIIGVALTDTTHAFRRNPFASRVGGRAFHAIGSGGLGAQLDGEWRATNSRIGLAARLRATQFESQRFYGYGNATPRIPAAEARIMRDEVTAGAAVGWHAGPDTRFSLGPVFRWVRPNDLPDESTLGDSAFGAAGAAATFTHATVDHAAAPHRGYRLSLSTAAYAPALDASGDFGSASGTVVGYVPLLATTIALRGGASRMWGAFPVHESAQLGGRSTLRGYEWNRFAGDASAYGNAELRVPLGRVALLTRGELGLILLADAGRVWVKGDSPTGWHGATGAGLSFQTLGRAVSAVYARGEVRRFYAYLGFPY